MFGAADDGARRARSSRAHVGAETPPVCAAARVEHQLVEPPCGTRAPRSRSPSRGSGAARSSCGVPGGHERAQPAGHLESGQHLADRRHVRPAFGLRFAPHHAERPQLAGVLRHQQAAIRRSCPPGRTLDVGERRALVGDVQQVDAPRPCLNILADDVRDCGPSRTRRRVSLPGVAPREIDQLLQGFRLVPSGSPRGPGPRCIIRVTGARSLERIVGKLCRGKAGWQ